MKTPQRLLCCALAVMLSSTGWARIGETLEECVSRYGEAKVLEVDITDASYPQALYLGEAKNPERTKDGFAQYGFEKAGVKIGAVFYNGKVAYIVFWKLSENEYGSKTPLYLTETEINAILAANEQGSPFQKQDEMLGAWYETEDEQIVARHDMLFKHLTIQTREMHQLLAELQSKREAENLKDF